MYDAYYDLPSAFRPPIATKARFLNSSSADSLVADRKRLPGPGRTRPLATEPRCQPSGLLHALRDKAEEPHILPTPMPPMAAPLTACQYRRSRMCRQEHSSTPSQRISRGAALQVEGGVTATFQVGRQGLEP